MLKKDLIEKYMRYLGLNLLFFFFFEIALKFMDYFKIFPSFVLMVPIRFDKRYSPSFGSEDAVFVAGDVPDHGSHVVAALASFGVKYLTDFLDQLTVGVFMSRLGSRRG